MVAVLPRQARGRRRKNRTTTAEPPRPEQVTSDLMDAVAIHRNILVSKTTGTWAAFMLGDLRWFYTSVRSRERLLDAQQDRLVELTGRRIQFRLTSEPFSWERWAEDLYNRYPNRPVDPSPEFEGEEVTTYVDRLAGDQCEIADAGKGSDRPLPFVLVRLTTEQVAADKLRLLFTREPLEGEEHKLRQEVRALERIMADEGFLARPLQDVELDWLLHRSAALGIPVDPHLPIGERQPGHIAPLSAAVRRTVDAYAEPNAAHVTVVANRGGATVKRLVSILTIEHIAKREILNPEIVPWLAYIQRLEMGVEVCGTFDVVSGADVAALAEAWRRRTEHVDEHWREHGERPPLDVEEGIEHGYLFENEAKSKHNRRDGVRLMGPIRIAVWGDDATEVGDNVNEVTTRLHSEQGITAVHDLRQYARYREFTPGNTHELVDFTQVMAAYVFVGSAANIANTAGEAGGFYWGQVVGGGVGSYFHDPFWGPRHNQSGFHTITGDQGAGKSVEGGKILYKAAEEGIRCVGFDPAASWLNLARLPELRKITRVVDLAGASPGTLNPYTLIPDPYLADYKGNEADYREALLSAAAERREYMMDTCLLLLPPRLVATDAGALAVIEDACEAAGGDFGQNPWRVIDTMRGLGNYANEIADRLERTSKARGSALVWPENRTEDFVGGIEDHGEVFTLFVMKGLVTPPEGVDRVYWMRAERMALPVLHLASRGLALRVLYTHQGPKVIVCDETGIMNAGQSSWGAFITRSSRDSRKRDGAVYSLQQNPEDTTKLAPQIANLIGSAWAGRMDEDSARAQLQVMKMPQGLGYEGVISRLPTGQFLRRDWNGNVEKFASFVRPHVLEALNTTPGAAETRALLSEIRLAEEHDYGTRLSQSRLALRLGRVA